MKNPIEVKILIAALILFSIVNTSYSQSSQSETDVNLIHKELYLNEDIPNSFVGVTSIGFEILKTGNVSLNVYDYNNTLIETLVDGEMEVGLYNVYFKVIDGMTPGEYYYKVTTDNKSTETKKMIISRY
ncbi:MAG: hypothetical protein ABIY50_03795 [Ignavibacteria bacterium]